MRFHKYHGLGNDYLVMDPAEVGRDLEPREIRSICHRNYGIGSDGILWGPLPVYPVRGSITGQFRLRIFNPDASEAEKSGNGLRIFSRYLFDRGLVTSEPFTIDTLGGRVRSVVSEGGRLVEIGMGKVSFDSTRIPVAGQPREVLRERIDVGGQSYSFSAATVGNPHCVILLDEISEEIARRVGPLVEVDPRFPNRTNVQFMKLLGRADIQIEIWERGAGYTLASGSSSSAAAAVARRLGLCDERVTVHMPGGVLDIQIADDWSVVMRGPVTRVGEGSIDAEALSEHIPSEN